MIHTSSLGDSLRNAGAGGTGRVTEMLQERLRHRSHPEVTVTQAKVPVTAAASGKIRWQAGMSCVISDVRGYVRLQMTELGVGPEFPGEKAGNSEKYPWQPGM